jgi:membrane protease YdiL (CAAX protease family)
LSWREGVAAWRDLERRHPPLFSLGVAVLIAGGLTAPLMEVGILPRPAQGRLGMLVAALAFLALLVGRRVFWNDAERRLRAAWRVFLFILITVIFFAVMAAGFRLRSGAFSTSGSSAILSLTLVQAVAVTLAAIIAVGLFDRRPLKQLGIVPGPGFGADLLFGLGLGALLMTMVFGWERLAGWVEVVHVARTRVPGEPFAAGILRMGATFLAVALSEELSSRGYILRTLAQGFVGRRVSSAQALAAAVFLSSGLFGFAHLGNPHATFVSTSGVALGGVVLALPYVLTGRLAISIGLHTTWNFFQGVVYGLPVSGITVPTTLLLVQQGGPSLWTGGAFGPEAGMLGLLANLLGGALILWRERRRHGSLGLCLPLVDGAPSGAGDLAPSGASTTAAEMVGQGLGDPRGSDSRA